MIRSSLRYLPLLLTFVFASSAGGSPELSRLRVKVLSDNSPVVGATVSLLPIGVSPVARTEGPLYTDETGECEFTQLASGTYSLRVSKLSFFLSEVETTSVEVSLSSGETRSVQSNLIKGGVVTGRLLSVDNEVVPGIPVTAMYADATNPASYNLPVQSESNVTSLSDDRGVFRIYGLRPGTYVIAVNAQRDSSLRKDILPFKYPDSSDSKNGGGVFIGLSQELKLPDIRVTANLGETCSISGTVLGKGNLPLAQANVTLVGEEHTFVDKLSTSAVGGFSFEGLAPGRYKITVSSLQGPYRAYEREIDLSTKRNTSLAVRLLEYPPVDGRTSTPKSPK